MKQDKAYKIKLLKLLEILRQETDEGHPIGTVELIKLLSEQGVECDRRTLALDIQVLNDYGYKVVVNKQSGHSTEYYVADRQFDIPELQILMDAVQAAKFITPQKTDILIDKIISLGGHKADLLKENIIEYNTVKHTNEAIYYNIDTIAEAIANGKKVSFRYFDYSINKERVFRRDGSRYYVNPISMVYTMENYYLVCYDDYHPNIIHYRIDRMTDVIMKQYDIVFTEAVKAFDMTEHHRSLFGMYNGEEKTVTFEITNRLIDAIIDKFGESIEFVPLGDEKVQFTAEVQISPQFMGWCLSFGSDLIVNKPQSVVEQIAKYAKEISNIYNG